MALSTKQGNWWDKGTPAVVEDGSACMFVDATITSAQVLALFATPRTLVAAPGANKALILEGAVFYKPAGTAYASVD